MELVEVVLINKERIYCEIGHETIHTYRLIIIMELCSLT